MPSQTAATLDSKIARLAAENKATLEGETGIFKRLIAEHAEVRALIVAAREENDGEQRLALFQTLKAKLTLHAEAEEKEFYNLLERAEATAETVQIQLDEHRVMEALLATLQNLHPIGSEWDELLGKLLVLFDGHVQREEHKLFVASKNEIDEPVAGEIESRFVEREAEQATHLDDAPQQKKYDLPLP